MGTQLAVVPATPPVFGDNPAQAQTSQAQTSLTQLDGTPFSRPGTGGEAAEPCGFYCSPYPGLALRTVLTSTPERAGLGVEYHGSEGDNTRGPRIYQTGSPGAANIVSGWGRKVEGKQFKHRWNGPAPTMMGMSPTLRSNSSKSRKLRPPRFLATADKSRP
jgi:hypothetical protein